MRLYYLGPLCMSCGSETSLICHIGLVYGISGYGCVGGALLLRKGWSLNPVQRCTSYHISKIRAKEPTRLRKNLVSLAQS